MSSDATPVVLPFPASASCAAPCDLDQVAPVAESQRGVRWVLSWAAVLAVLAWTASISMAFGYQLAVEQSLARAAAAGLREAACERATSHSVERSVRHQLVDGDDRQWPITVVTRRNGAAVSGVVRPAATDQLTVWVSVPTASVLPGWLRLLSRVDDDAALTAVATEPVAAI